MFRMPFTAEEDGILQLNPHHNFDFGLQFEQLFFSILPSVIFIATCIWRTTSQARKPIVVDAPTFQVTKVAAILCYVGLELSLLILAARGRIPVTGILLTSSALKLVSALFMTMLSILDHSRSPRPSVLLNIYLSLTLLLDAAQARTLFLSSDEKSEFTYSAIFTAAVVVKAGVLLLEARYKSKWIRWDTKKHSPEETSGIFSLSVLFWLNKMFLAGYKKVLALEDLYPLDSGFDAQLLHGRFTTNMNYSKLKGDKFGLAKVLVRTLKVPLLLPIIPNLALVGFKFCQPLFLEKLLEYLSKPAPLDANIGYGLTGASVLIYGGIAISSALSGYFHHRARTMARSILVTETFIQATRSRIGTADNNSALTLMSTDVERIKMGFRALHQVWAGMIQAALAAWMLYNRLGVAFVAPLATVTVCFVGVGILINFTGDSQRSWMAGVQKRVGLTATVIAGMKNLKMSGLSAAISDFVQNLRVEELAAGARFRKVTIIAALFAFSAQLLSPPLTFAFAQQAPQDVSNLFASLSFLTLLTTPLSQIFQAIPELASGLACLGRIQAFLECERRRDFRKVYADLGTNVENTRKARLDNPESAYAIVVKDGKFGWEADKFVLGDINTQVSESSLTAVIGPVGSGKSTFSKALLGETPFNEGGVVLGARFSRIGFCDQTPFLFNGSIRDNIVGFSSFDDERYAEVVDATCLRSDLAMLPQGDKTNTGSDGIALSGGQKQRISLARALYLQSDLLVLDDIFSGLDADTEEKIFQTIFGAGGVLRRRRTTVVLCTHSIKHLPSVDYIIALGGGTIVEQGTFGQLMSRSQGYVQCLGLVGSSSHNEGSSSEKRPERSMLESATQLAPSSSIEVTALMPDTSESRQVGDRTVYKHYAESMGWLLAACSLLFAALWGFFTNFPTIWLTYWTDDSSSEHPRHSFAYYMGIYALLQISAMLSLLFLGIILFVSSVKRAGARLHQDALRTLIRAPLSFFTKTDTGVVTNLFSQDLNLIDTELPDATLNTLFCTFQALGQAAVMLTSFLYLAISYPFLGGLLYLVQRFYLRTSRQLRLLDLETKSPLYTHFLDTCKGIVTLRAFGSLADDINKNARLINSSQRPAYLLMMIQEWLNLVLDVVVMIIAALLTTLAVQLHSNSAFAGASLFTLVSFGENLSGIVIYYTRLETSIGAVARLKTFNETVKPEDRDDEDVIPPEDWPQSGIIEFKGVSASYRPAEDDDQTVSGSSEQPNLALRDIRLTIHAGEKVAICGRTGSGKSSLIALLLKLLDPVHQTSAADDNDNAITIDQTPLRRIDRAALRERIIAVPQEAVFLPDGCTVQANLDPPGACTPAECQAVLEAVGLWGFVQERGGLAKGMSAGTLSAGQRQLLSLGRAVLRGRVRARRTDNGVGLGLGGDAGSVGGGILLLDEVSSSVDRETERVMQEIIAAEFKGYTMLAVSHRLDMIMDFDTVVVMDRGNIAEVGKPVVLVSQAGTRFGNLVAAGAG